ncbi:MAG: hypothetical protein KGL53_02020, partial [Elusimicrobia bacterium]|nr:hypothetical protein [Elusimicrobiota bacterium]
AEGTATLTLLSAGGGTSGTLAAAVDAALSRALAPLPQALALTRPLAKTGGWAVAYQSARPEGLDASSYRLPGEDADRFLAFERRPG